MVSSGKFGSSLPIIGSHEGAGTVIATGSEVKSFKPGDRIMCGLMRDGCGKCPTCEGPEDYRHYCPNAGPGLGIMRDGAFAEFLICDANQSNKLPDKVSFETAAPLACAGRTIYRGIVQSRVPKGEWLGLIGSGGGLGHLGIQFAKAFGMKVVGIDARDEGLELSKHFGADLAVDARRKKEEVVKEVQNATGGRGCYATVNISDGKTAADLACAITRMHGRMIQIAQVRAPSRTPRKTFEQWIYLFLPAGRSLHNLSRIHLPRYQS
jgi:propanol-preferring alcohol dehydrogenase